MKNRVYASICKAITLQHKLLAVLIDPDKFDITNTVSFLNTLPKETTHLFVGGSTAQHSETESVVIALKKESQLPIVLFPGNESQVTHQADALLFLTLISGRNPEYLIGQQVKAADKIDRTLLETIATSYVLIDGGNQSAIARVSQTNPLPQDDIMNIVNTAKAGELLGQSMVYLEAGSGALKPVSIEIIKAVKQAITIPLIVGGGIRKQEQRVAAYQAGADMVVMGTQFETN